MYTHNTIPIAQHNQQQNQNRTPKQTTPVKENRLQKQKNRGAMYRVRLPHPFLSSNECYKKYYKKITLNKAI